jgi:hypothetical protein
MLLKGLSRPQLLLPAWTARNLAFMPRHARNATGKGSNRQSQPKDEHTLSLFEELFPEEAKEQHIVKKSPASIGDPRRLQKDHRQAVKIVKHLAATEHKDVPKESAGNKRHDPHRFREIRNVSVLVLSNASKSLSLSDFLRLSPKGEHIDGWASGIIQGSPTSPITADLLSH